MGLRKRAQSTLEYAVIVSVVVAGLVVMQIYMRRAVEGKMHDSSDRLGEQYSAGNVTYKRVTTQPAGLKTTEYFGYDKDGNEAKGYSSYKVDTVPASPTTTDMKDGINGSASERINTGYQNEKLF